MSTRINNYNSPVDLSTASHAKLNVGKNAGIKTTITAAINAIKSYLKQQPGSSQLSHAEIEHTIIAATAQVLRCLTTSEASHGFPSNDFLAVISNSLTAELFEELTQGDLSNEFFTLVADDLNKHKDTDPRQVANRLLNLIGEGAVTTAKHSNLVSLGILSDRTTLAGLLNKGGLSKEAKILIAKEILSQVQRFIKAGVFLGGLSLDTIRINGGEIEVDGNCFGVGLDTPHGFPKSLWSELSSAQRVQAIVLQVMLVFYQLYRERPAEVVGTFYAQPKPEKLTNLDHANPFGGLLKRSYAREQPLQILGEAGKLLNHLQNVNTNTAVVR